MNCHDLERTNEMKFMKQLAIIFSISFIAEVLEYVIPLPIAASIYGLVLMLIGLVTHIIPLEKVESAADFLVEIMPLMFIPATAGIMSSVEELKQMLLPLTVILVVTTLLIMIVTGRTAQFLLRRDNLLRCGRKKACSQVEPSDGNGTEKDTAEEA